MDLVLILNFLVDYLLLLGTNRLAGFAPGWGRAAMGAGIGSMYAAACLIPGFSFLGNVLWRVVSLGAMAVISFGINRSTLQRTAMFLLLSFAMGGLAAGVNGNRFFMPVVCAVILWALCRVSFRDGVSRSEYVSVELSEGDRTVSVTALRDTGNTLKDPLTGEQILVAGAEIGTKLLGLSQDQLRHPVETIAAGNIRGLRLIPYQSVGQPAGLMLGYRFHNAKIGNKRSNPLVAFAPENIGRADMYQMLTGGAV